MYMLTTIDNPYDPREDFDKWYSWDMLHGYDTCGLIDRYCYSNDSLPIEQQEEALNQAMLDIISIDSQGLYKLLPID